MSHLRWQKVFFFSHWLSKLFDVIMESAIVCSFVLFHAQHKKHAKNIFRLCKNTLKSSEKKVAQSLANFFITVRNYRKKFKSVNFMVKHARTLWSIKTFFIYSFVQFSSLNELHLHIESFKIFYGSSSFIYTHQGDKIFFIAGNWDFKKCNFYLKSKILRSCLMTVFLVEYY